LPQFSAAPRLEDLLRGEDPVQVERLWQKMYDGTGLWGRRVTIAAIGAVETAHWDIAGKNPEQTRLRADLTALRHFQGWGR